MQTNTALLASALEYASRGWAVFPVLPDSGERRSGRVAPRLRPVDWERWATTDSVRVGRVWQRHPWGIGIACGPSNLLVIESRVDDEGLMPGEDFLHGLALRHGSLPATWTVSAPDGTISRYFQQPGQPVGTGALGQCLQVRGEGHYTVAPPTVTWEGAWLLLQNRPVAPAPQWLVDVATNVQTSSENTQLCNTRSRSEALNNTGQERR